MNEILTWSYAGLYTSSFERRSEVAMMYEHGLGYSVLVLPTEPW